MLDAIKAYATSGTARIRAWSRTLWAEPSREHLLVVGHMCGEALSGAERSLLDILDAVDRDRFRLSCLLPGPEAARSSVCAQEVACRVDALLLRPYAWSSPATSSPAWVERFRALYTRLGVSLVHVNTLTLLDPVRAARKAGLPTVVHVRELLDAHPLLAGQLGDSALNIHAALTESASLLLANSAATAASLGAGPTTRVLYNCVDDALFALPPPRPGPLLRVGMLSCNGAHKGLARLGDIARRVAVRRRDVRFVVIGRETPHCRALREQAWEQGFGAMVEFRGYLPSPSQAIAGLDMVVSLSDVPESFGRTLAEGKAAGRPVLAVRRGATPELVRHGVDGFLVEPEATEDAAEHIVRLAGDPELRSRLGYAGRQHAAANFSRQRFERGLRALHTSLAGPAQRPSGRMWSVSSP